MTKNFMIYSFVPFSAKQQKTKHMQKLFFILILFFSRNAAINSIFYGYISSK